MLENLKWILGILFVGVLIFFIVPIVLGFFNPDPLPYAVRIGFDRIDLVRGEVVSSARRAKSTAKNPATLANEQREYDDVAGQLSSLVDLAVRGVNLNRVDSEVLVPALATLLNKAESLRDHLQAKSNLKLGDVGLGKMLREAFTFISETANGWTKLRQDRDGLAKYVISDLNKMKWPQWQSLK